MHVWVGRKTREEVLNSAVFWEHMQAGITGVDTWLFFGPLNKNGHWMIGAHWNNGSITKTGKYEIFKQVVNNANGGKYVEVTSPTDQLVTDAFTKENILYVWVLNESTTQITNQDRKSTRQNSST